MVTFTRLPTPIAAVLHQPQPPSLPATGAHEWCQLIIRHSYWVLDTDSTRLYESAAPRVRNISSLAADTTEDAKQKSPVRGSPDGRRTDPPPPRLRPSWPLNSPPLLLCNQFYDPSFHNLWQKPPQTHSRRIFRHKFITRDLQSNGVRLPEPEKGTVKF